VYISKISLKNIRGFKSLEFDLDRGNGEFAGWTVFTGSNGSGKSTLLKAIALCLVPLKAKAILQSDDFRFFWRKNHDDSQCVTRLDFSRSIADDKAHQSYTGGDFESFHSQGQRVFMASGIFTLHERDDLALKGFFSCGYGPFRRITTPNPNAEQIMRAKDTERFATLFFEAATLSEVDPWLTTLKFRELEKDQHAADQLAFFLDLIRDNLLPDGFTIDRVDSRGLWLRDSKGVELSWFEMSDGHRVAIILVADILRHMIGTYGLEGLYARDEAGKICIKRSGVVLIDEIDAHLHPSWQREIGFWLKRHFPKVQFLVTSHSPIILQAADPNGLFVLPEPGSEDEPRALSEEEYRKIIASTTDTTLLSEAFGLQNTRSENAVKERAKYSRLHVKKRAGAPLSASEEDELKRINLFFAADPDTETE
jgi:hypothetical protein